jgi:hypothetical protein
MHIQLATLVIASALISSLILVLNRGDKILPIVALLAVGLEAALHFGVIQLSFAKFRIDVILPALIVIAGGVCWARATAKGPVTAAAVLFAVGAIQLLAAVHLLG